MVNYSKSSLLKELGDTQALIQQREQNVIDKTNRIADLKLMILETQDDARKRDLKQQVGILWGQIKRENQYIDTLKDSIEDIQIQLEEMGVTISRKSKGKRSVLKRSDLSGLNKTMKKVVGVNQLKF
ncbi:MAG: hypothetical protein GX279_13665 [Clostridiaceae bacterium]|jgi:hypothetical protein|nr:hypothetical protein [Clostridiaceae bacterium]